MEVKTLWIHPKATKEERLEAIKTVEQEFPGFVFKIEYPTLEEVTALRQMFDPDITDEEFWESDIPLLFEGDPPFDIAWNRNSHRQDEPFMLFPKTHVGMMDDN